MMPRDQTVASLSLRHLNVLDALRADAGRPEGAEGLTPGDIRAVGSTSWVGTLINALINHGYVVSLDHGRYFLEREPTSRGAPERGEPGESQSEDLTDATFGVPLETVPTRLFDMPATPSYQHDIAA